MMIEVLCRTARSPKWIEREKRVAHFAERFQCESPCRRRDNQLARGVAVGDAAFGLERFAQLLG
jgi:hypothetical protein